MGTTRERRATDAHNAAFFGSGKGREGMTYDAGACAAMLGLPPGRAGAFARLAAAMQSDPGTILLLVVKRVVAVDEDMRALGMRGVAHWMSGRTAAKVAAEHGLRGLPLDRRCQRMVRPVRKGFLQSYPPVCINVSVCGCPPSLQEEF